MASPLSLSLRQSAAMDRIRQSVTTLSERLGTELTVDIPERAKGDQMMLATVQLEAVAALIENINADLSAAKPNRKSRAAQE
jgi:hypothetical protein